MALPTIKNLPEGGTGSGTNPNASLPEDDSYQPNFRQDGEEDQSGEQDETDETVDRSKFKGMSDYEIQIQISEHIRNLTKSGMSDIEVLESSVYADETWAHWQELMTREAERQAIRDSYPQLRSRPEDAHSRAVQKFPAKDIERMGELEALADLTGFVPGELLALRKRLENHQAHLQQIEWIERQIKGATHLLTRLADLLDYWTHLFFWRQTYGKVASGRTVFG